MNSKLKTNENDKISHCYSNFQKIELVAREAAELKNEIKKIHLHRNEKRNGQKKAHQQEMTRHTEIAHQQGIVYKKELYNRQEVGRREERAYQEQSDNYLKNKIEELIVAKLSSLTTRHSTGATISHSVKGCILNAGAVMNANINYQTIQIAISDDIHKVDLTDENDTSNFLDKIFKQIIEDQIGDRKDVQNYHQKDDETYDQPSNPINAELVIQGSHEIPMEFTMAVTFMIVVVYSLLSDADETYSVMHTWLDQSWFVNNIIIVLLTLLVERLIYKIIDLL